MKTLGELGDSFALYAVCVPCQRMRPLPIKQLIAQHGPKMTIVAVRERLRCERCAQARRDIRIVFTGEQGRAAAFSYRRSSKKRGPNFKSRLEE